MASHAHVPKFGQWDKDDIPYTAFFENARREKSGMRMNPNDPEENPEAFMLATRVLASNGVSRRSPSPVNASNNRQAWNHRRIRSESVVDKSNSDYSHKKPGQQHAKSEHNKDVNNGRYAFSWTGHPRHKSTGSSIPDDNKGWQHNMSQTIPKFGAWDETDPKSGEGFTAIFNKVKQERQFEASNFASLTPQPSNYSDSQAAKRRGLKVCCCFSSRK